MIWKGQICKISSFSANHDAMVTKLMRWINDKTLNKLLTTSSKVILTIDLKNDAKQFSYVSRTSKGRLYVLIVNISYLYSCSYGINKYMINNNWYWWKVTGFIIQSYGRYRNHWSSVGYISNHIVVLIFMKIIVV